MKWTKPKTSEELLAMVEKMFEESRKKNPKGTTKGLAAWFEEKKSKKR